MSVVYCPRTHEYFQHAKYPLQAMLATGVRVALGTDSRASNPDLSLLNEMRCVARLHSVAPAEILRMGTLSGAEALGLNGQVGSISPGKQANLFALSCGADEPAESVLRDQEAPIHVWLGGEPVPLKSML